MSIPHPIPYQGSKRNLAKYILECIPKNSNKIIEPFAGSAAISIACSSSNIGKKYILNDLNQPLSRLIELIANKPEEVINLYTEVWNAQLEMDSVEHFYVIREEFNRTQEPVLLLYLLTRCVKNAVRYNDKGEFNQSPDKRRKGKNPKTMSKDIEGFSKLMSGKVEVLSKDYTEILDLATTEDLVYMDPPYQGTTGASKRYIQSLDFDKFVRALEKLNEREIPYIISFDGSTGNKVYGSGLPKHLELKRISLNAGVSSQSTLTGEPEQTTESLYLSKYVKISERKLKQIQQKSSPEQLTLEV